MLKLKTNRVMPLLGMVLACAASLSAAPPAGADEIPKVHDPRLTIELVASDPDIVHPIGVALDARGRLLVIESHTHFPPEGYAGPKHDRVRIVEDTDGDGRADRFTTFYEGTHLTMDIAAHPDGSIYLATRSEILRLRDTTGDGRADDAERVVLLDTSGNYPHNGLSGLAFDSAGNLYFGLGENLGAAYTLRASDGSTIAGGGEGGSVFWCTADGRRLRRVATGFWNPFGVTLDVFGRVLAIDNDPDSSPPCRLVHVVEGGDYGYQFRYGRSGRHPFQAWNGQLPGTLPMVSGTGEAPCEVISYESDGLPDDYRGDLLITSWAEHCLERHTLRERGASLAADRRIVIEGDADFRPVGLAVAPDGSLYMSDWVLRDYKLHGRGRIWHIRQRDAAPGPRPQNPQQALASAHRPLREWGARRLAANEAGRAVLLRHIYHADVRVRAAALAALVDSNDRQLDLASLAGGDAPAALRAMAVRALVGRGENVARFANASLPAAVRYEAISALPADADPAPLLPLLADEDPFLRHAATMNLARRPDLLRLAAETFADVSAEPRRRAGLVVALRTSGLGEAQRLLPKLLRDPDEQVRLLAVKWISDARLAEYRSLVAEALEHKPLSAKMCLALATTLAQLDGRKPNDRQMADFFLARLTAPDSQAADRIMALRLVPPTHPKLSLEELARLAEDSDAELRLEAVRTLVDYPNAARFALLAKFAGDTARDEPVRAQAIAGLAPQPQPYVDSLLLLATSGTPPLRDEALRALTGTKLPDDQQQQLAALGRSSADVAALVARITGREFAGNRPPRDQLDAWLGRLKGGDAAAGQRIFFHPTIARCSRCHRVEGRGSDIGPDLSTIGRAGRKAIVQSLLQPSREVAPHFQTWAIVTDDGRVRSGMLISTQLDEQGYLDTQGHVFKVNTRDIIERKPLESSLMPEGCADELTDQELRDLVAYLVSLKGSEAAAP